jgi:hypothetical protein
LPPPHEFEAVVSLPHSQPFDETPSTLQYEALHDPIVHATLLPSQE